MLDFIFRKRALMKKDLAEEIEKSKRIRKTLLKAASKMASLEGDKDWFLREEPEETSKAAECLEKYKKQDHLTHYSYQ